MFGLPKLQRKASHPKSHLGLKSHARKDAPEKENDRLPNFLRNNFSHLKQLLKRFPIRQTPQEESPL